jgi:hypothetical protein
MAQEGIKPNKLKETITRGGYRFVILWAAGILLIYAVGGYLGVRTLLTYRAETEKFQQNWIGSATTDPNVRAAEIKMAPGAKPVDVLVGIYINSIGEISLKESSWTADFDIWFRWTGDEVGPGTTFEVVNGQIDQRDKKEAYVTGREHYERYRVKARLTKFFDSSRFPFSDQGLTIQVEDRTHEAERLRYVADEQGSGLTRSGVLQSLKITKSLMAVKLHSYGSRRGDPRYSPNTPDVHSRFIYAILVSPPGTALYIKMFQALFASVAVALIALFIKVIMIDCRFGLPVGGFFASVANNIFVGWLFPPGEGITLTAMVNAIGLVTIFLILVESTISLYILDTRGQDRLSRVLDKVSFVVLVLGYVVLNLILPLAARS